MAALAVLVPLGGCQTMQSMNPVNWWHSSEGGKVTEPRQAPPGADQPYPNLATVPGKPEPPDKEAMKKLTAALVADRTNAQYAAAKAPVADPSLPSASPGLFGVGTLPPPPPPGAATASMPAAAAPPAPPAAPATPPAPPSKAPVAPVQKAPLEAPPASPPAPAADAAPPPPALPVAPPPRPGAAPAAPAPAAQSMPAAAPQASGGTHVAFPPGAATLQADASQTIKAFAGSRGGATIAVTGYGDADSSTPAAQAAAMSLALSRAQAVANALTANGVPASAIRINAEAAGRGAAMRLLQ